MSLEPLAEWGGIDLDDGALDESVRPDELVVGGVVNLQFAREIRSICSCRTIHAYDAYDSENPGLASGMFASPREVTSLQTKGTVLQVSSTDTNSMDALKAKLSTGWLAAELELSLLAVVGALSPSGRTFVPGGTGDTYTITVLWCMIISQVTKRIVSITITLNIFKGRAATHPFRRVLRLVLGRCPLSFGG